jgi:hypothetical protein
MSAPHLIVDDDLDILTGLKRQLNGWHHTFTE